MYESYIVTERLMRKDVLAIEIVALYLFISLIMGEKFSGEASSHERPADTHRRTFPQFFRASYEIILIYIIFKWSELKASIASKPKLEPYA